MSGEDTLLEVSDTLTGRLSKLSFKAPVSHVYNPLEYARPAWAEYVRRYAGGPKEVVLLGMNPGPWGMAQTGVPFGEISMVRDWMGIETEVGKPEHEHPKRPIEGFGCSRSEVSGRRLWGWARDRFGTADEFFSRFFVANYCPLVFMADSGRNLTPDKLPVAERRPLLEACDAALAETIEHLDPDWIIGVGAFAEKRAREALAGSSARIARILHPSPASPAANRGWAVQAEKQLRELGIHASL